ncbi:MAG TPA: hypothetical protein VN048_07065 [Verrucomicrobiae bacterium]|jgi:hypothetical protein|nr:hypothetical protein [Verrucomicrobiae bacterium]
MKGVVNLVCISCDWAICFQIGLLITGTVGCQSGETRITGHPSESDKVCVVIYGRATGAIVVFSNGSYFWEEFANSQRNSPRAIHTGWLGSELLASLQQSVIANPQWLPNEERVPTYIFEPDDSQKAYPDCVRELVAFVQSTPAPPHLTAAQIREKILGTWFVEIPADGPRKTVTVRFDRDGSFHASSRGIGEVVESRKTDQQDNLIYEATWQARNGGFVVTQTNSLPRSNLFMFGIDLMDDHEIICSHMSVGGRTVFKR